MPKANAQDPTRFNRYITSVCSPVSKAGWGLKTAQGTPADPYRQPSRKNLQRLKK